VREGETNMLIGEYEHSVDVKGRLIMPSKIRDEIGYKFIVTKGLDGCLFVFPINEWQAFQEKLKALPISDKNARDFTRFFFAGAIECEMDKQGRFLISSNLREFAGIDKDVITIGMNSRLEIWSKEKWKQCDGNISAEEIAVHMTNLGI
jgi:MraZ protein